MAKSKKKVLMPASIRNKLLAAVAMLMVSSIMVVSSTYAWFTLSTAPEVKNISTTVAGNGSLEIALMPADGLLGSIKSGFSAAGSGGTVVLTTANTTWGNVINLSDPSYGLEKVNLNPARLNVTEGASVFTDETKPLAIATYGYDGRIDEILANTSLKSYEESTFKGSGYGVRAIGEANDVGILGDTYGYVVDLAFRLNTTNNTDGGAAKGKLLLQTEEKQRIYNDSKDASTNEETLGGGSYMSFDANGSGLDVETLMKSIRVTFVENYGRSGVDTDPVILGTARLGEAETTATGKLAKLYLYEGEKQLTGTEAILIDAMEKNTAVQISAIVWLDGDKVQNASVSSVEALAKATLNLQFSTDVELKPADNNALFKGNVE